MPEVFDQEAESSADVHIHVKADKAALHDLIDKATLSSDARNDLKDSDFALPGRRYPIHDEAHARNALARGAQHATPEELATIRRKVKSRYPGIDVSKVDPAGYEVTVPLIKSEEQGIVYAVVLSPGLRDSQGDVITAEDIEKAAHEFLVSFRKHDVQHSEVTKDADGAPIASTVESYIAPVEMTLGEPPQKVLKGSWVQAIKIHDEQTKQDIRDAKITGVSIGGTGMRIPD